MNSCRGITLLLLGLFIQGSSTANTTQSYYFELEVESSAFGSFSLLLGNITVLTVGNATVSSITITTDCQSNICSCAQNYSWSTDVCNIHPECCQNNNSCSSVLPGAMCLYKNSVLVDGSFTIKDGKLPANHDEEKKILTKTLTSIYSSMNWFDSLNITNLRSGSVIGDFVMLINGPFDLSKLVNTTNKLQNTLNATFTIITSGFITITAPDRIGYDTAVNITCTTPDSLDNVNWYIQKGASKQRITNGTEATVTQDVLSSMIILSKASEIWKGIFICDYTSENSSNIIHRASVYLDVALLPQIFITSYPQFPNCRLHNTDSVMVKCIIDNSTETYNVTWLPVDSALQPTTSIGNTTIYNINININCQEKKDVYNATCIFTNRENNTRNATVKIPVIYADSIVCSSSDDWPEAKANFTAILQCNANEIGFKSRDCANNKDMGVWKDVNSQCVNTEIWNLLATAQNLQRGYGLVKDNANNLFDLLKVKSEDQIMNTFPNINASVDVLDTLQNASKIQNTTFNDSMVTNFVKSSSNLLNISLKQTWNSPAIEINYSLAIKYLKAVEGVANQIETSKNQLYDEENVKLMICNTSVESCTKTFNISLEDDKEGTIYQIKINNLPDLLPQYLNNDPSEFILSVTAKNARKISMDFPTRRVPNHKIFCLYFDFDTSKWSDDGCKWGGVFQPNTCICDHLSAFTSLMSKEPVVLKYMDEITYTGLGFSICSLVLCLAIEFVVWNTVVKSNIAHFRHTVLVNIALCLLIAHGSFLAASSPNPAISQWCFALTVMKHFCFLAVFFWMLCMSLGLLHQMIFVFVQLRKKVYLGFCFSLGYICPLFIVICTIITYDNGDADSYYVNETCWLKYESALHGSIHAFVIPVGVIVLVNMFTMVVVISRILKPTLSEGKSHDEKEIVRSVIRTVVLLTPTLGITWIFGFCVLLVDLTMYPFAQIVNYSFTIFNSFQGFFILLTGCFGEKKVRDALLMRIRPQHSAHYTSKSSTSMTAAVKKK